MSDDAIEEINSSHMGVGTIYASIGQNFEVKFDMKKIVVQYVRRQKGLNISKGRTHLHIIFLNDELL